MANLRDVRRMTAAMTRCADEHDMPITVRQVGLLAEAAARGLSTTQPTAGPVPRRAASVDLSPADVQVLALVASGLDNEQVAHRMGYTSINTVKNQLRHVFRALGARDRANAVGIVLATGLVPPGMVELPAPVAPTATFSEAAS